MSVEAYEARQRSDHRGVDLISDALPFGRVWYAEPSAVRATLAINSVACRIDIGFCLITWSSWPPSTNLMLK
jgi:hypothetical protein